VSSFVTPDSPCPVLIRDLPQDQRPREKLAQLGAAALDNAELLALFLGTGTKGSSAVGIGRNLLASYGSLAALGGLPLGELAAHHGLGPAKASKLAAAFELGARVAREQIAAVPLETPESIHRVFAPQFSHLPQENVVVVSLDTRLRHVGTNLISVGTVNECTAHPREVLRPVITRAAPNFVLLHNHPSGDPTPSRSDISVTADIVAAAGLMKVHLVDHIILGKPSPGRQGYYSFREGGLL
jgi:DNA repair protein RadC